MKSSSILIAYIVLLAFLILAIIYIAKHSPSKPVVTKGMCKPATCGAIDPVSEPEYNMKEVIKQSILLEEHLAEKRKRCKDCIVKHYMAIIGYCSEAVCLAGTKISKYPLMESLPSFYETSFQQWLKDKESDANLLLVEEQLRAKRKELVAIYILNDQEEH